RLLAGAGPQERRRGGVRELELAPRVPEPDAQRVAPPVEVQRNGVVLADQRHVAQAVNAYRPHVVVSGLRLEPPLAGAARAEHARALALRGRGAGPDGQDGGGAGRARAEIIWHRW